MKKRSDNRKFDEMREIEAKVGIIKRAKGSAMFRMGRTIALAAVYGPRELHPRFLQDPKTGILRCNYNMMAFSGSGERIRPGPSRRSKEISLITKNSLTPVLDLSEYATGVVDVFIELIQSDAGTRCAGICAASLALADAGFQMKDLISAVAIGKVGSQLFVDPTKEEEDMEGMADIPISMMPGTGKITSMQLDGYIKKDEIKEIVKLAKKACQQIYKIQQKALKEKYGK